MEVSSRQVCDDLFLLVSRVKACVAGLAEAHDLTPQQLFALYMIRQSDMTMGKLAGCMHCDASNITGIIDRLVAQGLATRQERQADRRAKLLELTDKGREVIEEIVTRVPHELGCERLTGAQRSGLHDLIGQLVSN